MGALLFGVLVGTAYLLSPLASIALIGGLASLYLLVPHPLRVACILIAAIALTSATPRGAFVPFLKVNELVLVLAFILLFFEGVAQSRMGNVPGTPLVAFIILAAGTSLAPTVYYWVRGAGLDMEEIFSLIAPMQYLVLFWFFAVIAKTTQQRHAIVQFMFLCCSGVALVGLLQAAKIGPISSFLKTWYPSEQTFESAQWGRVTSVLGAWNCLGTFMMFNLLVASAIQYNLDRPIFQLNTLVMVLLAVPCLLATNFYAGVLGLVAGFIILKTIDPRGLKVVIPILLIVAVAAVLLWPSISARLREQFPGDELLPETIQYRITLWEDYYIPSIQKSIVWGVNPSSQHVFWEFPESQYIYLLFRSGLVSLLSHLLWVVILLAWLSRIIRQERGLTSKLALSIAAQLIVLSIMGLTNPVFTYSATIDFLWINLGLVVSERMWGQ